MPRSSSTNSPQPPDARPPSTHPQNERDYFDNPRFPFDFPDGDPCSREAQEAIDEELAQEDHWQRKTKHESIMPPDF